MATAPIQYDLPTRNGASAAYEGTPGPDRAAAAGDYIQNRGGLRKPVWLLEPFKRPEILQPRW